jgi:hypothetical protein
VPNIPDHLSRKNGSLNKNSPRLLWENQTAQRIVAEESR